MVRIAPSLLSADFTRLAQQVELVERAGAHQLHLDVMDGHYVPNLTFGPMVVRAVRSVTALPLDAHLMIRNPDASFHAYVEAGANAIAVHPETAPHLHKTLDDIRRAGARPGIAVNPLTPLATLPEAIAASDYAIVMSVNPGWGGQSFIEGSFDRVRKVREMADRLRPGYEIIIDGGMDAARIPDARAAGADTVVAGSAIFGAPDPAAALGEMLAA